MGKLIVGEFLTLDGVMQAPGAPDEDRRGGFEHGGWQMNYFDDVFGKFVTDGIMSADAFLLGRKTYEIFAAYWPNAPAEAEEIAGPLNEKPKFVVSNSLSGSLPWNNSSVIAVDDIPKLKEDKVLRVIGSGDLVQTLARENLVDVYELMIHPLVLGAGTRLFRDGNEKRPLELMDSMTTNTGVLIASYRPA